jgi:SAM-dependent methyltransferase
MAEPLGYAAGKSQGEGSMSDTRSAYDQFARIYDEFNAANDYEMWFGALLPQLEKHGLGKTGRLLDVGCGTGRAFPPMLRRGWQIQGCDLSPGMLEEARSKFGDAVPLAVADVRELPSFGEFELVWALNDVVNYLTEDGDLELALAGMRANLAPGGLLLFDTNTLGLFDSHFGDDGENEMSVGDWRWRGLSTTIEPGGAYEAQISGDGVETHAHRQRHHPVERVRDAIAAAGLEHLASLGQQEVDEKVLLTEPPDEQRDYKIIHIARAAT